MANINKKQTESNNFDHTPFGNVVALRYTLKTNASGAVEPSDTSAAVAVNDVIRIGLLPNGLRFIDSEVIVKTGMTATATADLGFAYADGVDDAGTPQSATYFGSALNTATAARLRNATSNTSLNLPKPAYLTLTQKTVANAKASEIEIVIFAIAEGKK